MNEMASQMWHGDDADFGAHTRYGWGWGPIEVIRANRMLTVSPNLPLLVDEQRLTRTVEMRVAGTKRLIIKVFGEGESVTVYDDDGLRLLPVIDHSAYQKDVEPVLDDESTSPEDRLKKTLVEFAATTGTVEDIRDLVKTATTALTPQRRKSRYLPAEVTHALDELSRILELDL